MNREKDLSLHDKCFTKALINRFRFSSSRHPSNFKFIYDEYKLYNI